jgi:hypothetical protein
VHVPPKIIPPPTRHAAYAGGTSARAAQYSATDEADLTKQDAPLKSDPYLAKALQIAGQFPLETWGKAPRIGTGGDIRSEVCGMSRFGPCDTLFSGS